MGLLSRFRGRLALLEEVRVITWADVQVGDVLLNERPRLYGTPLVLRVYEEWGQGIIVLSLLDLETGQLYDGIHVMCYVKCGDSILRGDEVLR